ncbi:hypothetical protein D9758_009177 [Tetrapyrgos nigripes]|uniref:Uncharacterized protein n=1 Tax=Tetrapyrgos nigripes TaxID=182062 RepID=A0A8H5G8K0_9AGAR|nr:hypothetical protein D9758_009177 [Tetrapyrgos nigripes]
MNELIDQILAYALSEKTNRPSWHTSSRDSPLLVSKTFHRIGLGHYYHSIHLSSQQQSLALLAILQSHPDYSPWIKHLSIDSIFESIADILSLCPQLVLLDLSLDAPSHVDLAPFCTALSTLTSLSSLTIRKPASVYLTQPRVRYVLSAVAECVSNGTWQNLREVDMPFKVSSDDSASLASPAALGGMLFPALPPPAPTLAPINPNLPAALPSPTSPTSPGPITFLSQGLSTLPNLRTFSTQLPTVWNEVLLTVSKNDKLEKIVLGSASAPVAPGSRRMSSGSAMPPRVGGVMLSGLYMSEAKKHPRLVDLIKAGTPILRNRSQTMAIRPGLAVSASMPCVTVGGSTSTSSSSASASASSSAGSAAKATATEGSGSASASAYSYPAAASTSASASASNNVETLTIPVSWRRRSSLAI